MDVYLLLDALLVILVALFIPIGFWRGAYREAFVTLGILFGASLGRFWGEDWGAELAAVTRLHESGGAFMIAMLCLISATFLLGYSSGAALPVPDPGWIARTLGALVAGANGALLLSFALRDIRVYLLSSEDSGFLDSAVIAPFLSNGTGWILLVAAAVFVPITLVLALFAPDVEEEEYYDDEEFEVYEEVFREPYAQRTMQIDQRRPAPRSQPAPASAPRPAEETRPVQNAQQPAPQPAKPQQRVEHSPPGPSPEPAATQRRVPQPDETQPHRPRIGPQPPREKSGEPAQGQGQSFGAQSVEQSITGQQAVFGYRPSANEQPTSTPAQSDHLCPKCHADISQADGYCPRCGERI